MMSARLGYPAYQDQVLLHTTIIEFKVLSAVLNLPTQYLPPPLATTLLQVAWPQKRPLNIPTEKPNMSSRQMKKLQKQKELLRLQTLADDQDDSSGDDITPPKPRASAFAGFAALGGGDDDDDEDVDGDDDAGIDSEKNKAEEEDQHEIDSDPDEPTPPPARKAKKPKKKKKKANKTTETPEKAPAKPKDDEDEIDKALKELSLQKSAHQTENQSTQNMYDVKLARLLSISFDHLKVINELRAMFGQETIDSVRNQEESQSRDDRRRNRRGGPQQIQMDMETFLKGRPGEKIPDVLLRKNPFMQGKEDWPKASAGGLKMEAVTDERVEPTEYRFCHDKVYGGLEVQFYSLVDMMDPMRIVHFVHQHPYHVNSLIQTSRVAKNDHNAALAGDLCERALFTFGRVTLSSFRKKLERGVARLDFHRPENRQFWLAGYHYIKSLLQKGTYDTALEWTKLYLSLSPQDEYGMMNFTHVAAVYAYESKWFIALCNSSYFQSDEYDLPMKDYHKQTCVLALLQLGDKEAAVQSLVQGMETLPWLYTALCSAVNIDTPRAIWGVQPPDENANIFTQLYLHMAKDLWKRDGIELLKQAGELATKVDLHSLPPAEDVTLSIGRFIYLDNTPELMGLVPSSMLHASPNFDYDPLPPPRDANIFSNEWQSIPWRRDLPGVAQRRDAGMNDLLRMLQLQRGGGQGAGDDGAPGGLEDTRLDEVLQMLRAEDAEEEIEALRAADEEAATGAAEEAFAEGLAAAGPTEGGLMGVLARMLQPLAWLRGGPAPGPDADAYTDEDSDGESTDSGMPDLEPVERGDQAVDEDDDEDDDEMPDLEPVHQ